MLPRYALGVLLPVLLILLASPPAQAQDGCDGETERRRAVMRSNAITTSVGSSGSVSTPGLSVTNLRWNGLAYGYEFGPFVAAEVLDNFREEGRARDFNSVPKRDAAGNVVFTSEGDTVWVMHIVSDGLSTPSGGEVSPIGTRWGWTPVPCTATGLPVYVPEVDSVATSIDADTDGDGRPDTWPAAWYDADLGTALWPRSLPAGALEPAQEGFFMMDDGANREFAYDPFPSDNSRRGLGLEVQVRAYQWSDERLADALVVAYTVTNRSEKDLEQVLFGLWGDPSVGGPNDWADDLLAFDVEEDLFYTWDSDGHSDVPGRSPGYMGLLLLHAPGAAHDGIDNDGDGLVDERQDDGLDNDGDWSAATDDVGRDGLPDTGDAGESDGLPTAGDPDALGQPGEPHYELNDPDESDQLGVTAVAAPPFGSVDVSNDEQVWGRLMPGRFEKISRDPGDNVMMPASGHFALKAGERQRWAVAFVFGTDLNDLLVNVEQVRAFYEEGFRLDVADAVEDYAGLTSRLALEKPYPNPAREDLTLTYTLPEAGQVRLAAYDVLGREVAVLADERMPAGRHKVQLEAAGLAPGTYFVRLLAPGGVQTQPLVVVR